MPKPTDKERVQAYQKKVTNSSKAHLDWENEFDCDNLEQMYYGHQWESEAEAFDHRKYVINLIKPALDIAKPSMLFGIPKYSVKPRPNHANDPLSGIEARAKLQETTLNTCVSDPKIGFEMETGLAVLDSQFRLGICYVGYTADFIDNPNAGKPMLNDKGDELRDAEDKPVKQPERIPQSEQLFIKWIPGKQWRISENAPNRLSGCDWCGYYEWHRIDDLKANPRYKNTSGLKATGKVRDEQADTTMSDEQRSQAGMVQVWFIWDNRAKKRVVFVQGGEKFLLEEEFSFLPFAVLKFNERLGKFLPLPEVYNWVHPQRELNDTREMQRIHRKRAVRRFARKPSVEETEFQKLIDCEDMTCIVTPNPESDIKAIEDAPLDRAVMANVAVTHDDFTRVSHISGEAQQVAQSETATQANLIALASRVQDSSKRKVVAMWLADLGRIMLLTMVERMSLPIWIQKNVDPSSEFAAVEAVEIMKIWEEIEASDLGDIDNDITVEITSLSPVAQAQERDEWLAGLALLFGPSAGMAISNSPYLLRKTMGYFNIHNERDLVEISKALQANMLMQQIMGMAGGPAKGKAGEAAPGATPTNPEIAGQLQQQLPVEASQGAVQ